MIARSSSLRGSRDRQPHRRMVRQDAADEECSRLFHSERQANPLIGNQSNLGRFSECALTRHAKWLDLQSAPFAARDTPPDRG